MFARRSVRAALRGRRRTVYQGIGAALVVALGGAAGTRSWVALTAVLVLIMVVLTGILWDLRGTRMAVGRLPRRLHALRERVDGIERRQAALALDLYDQAKLTGRPLTATSPGAMAHLITQPLLERGDVLEAYEVARAGVPDLLPLGLPTLRALRDGLRDRGYLGKALEPALICARLGRPRDGRLCARIEGDIAVLSGRFQPQVAPVSGYHPQPGRILHVVGKSLPRVQAGYTLRTHYIALAQRDAGLDPVVVTQTGFTGVDANPVDDVDGIRYHRLPGPGRGAVPLDEWLSRHTAGVAGLVAELRPAVLHAASDFVNAMAARQVGTAFGIPVVYESRGFWEETWLSHQARLHGWDLPHLAETYGLPDLYLWRRETEDRCRREADSVVTLADVMADRIEAGGVPRDRIAVIPNAVQVASFPVLTRDAATAARLGISPDVVVLGYISSLVEYEGIDTLITAYASVKAASPTPVALLIVGDGRERQRLEAQVERLGLTDVVFTGQVPHDTILDYYSVIDIFVVPRRAVEVCHLVTPLKPFEAFSTGRTVVLSNVRALAGIARQSGAAELFEAGDATSLADVLLSLLDDPDRRRELAAAGAAWVREERTWTANAKTYALLYAQLLDGGTQIGRQRAAVAADRAPVTR